MTSPDSPLNNHPSHAETPYDYDGLAKKDASDLAPAEAEALAYWRSSVSQREYDPETVAPEDRVVETVDRASVTLGDLAKDEDLEQSLRDDAQGVIDSLKENAGNEVKGGNALSPAKGASTDGSKDSADTKKASDSSK